MTLKKLALAVTAAALVSSVSVAYAAPGDRAAASGNGEGHGLRHKVNRIFGALDTDGSETITLDEWLSKPSDKAADQFDRIDTDDDDLISLEEFLALGGDRGDDIDRDELRACVADATGSDVPERPDRETRFENADTNGDGFIDFDEFLAGKTENATERFNRIDTDDDGAITKIELAEALSAKREHRRAVRDCVEDQQETDELLNG